MGKILTTDPRIDKINILGSMFPDKIEFDGKECRTNSYNKVLDIIFKDTNQLRQKKKEESDEKSASSLLVPRAGVEPARTCVHWCLRPARLPIPPSGQELANLVICGDKKKSPFQSSFLYFI